MFTLLQLLSWDNICSKCPNAHISKLVSTLKFFYPPYSQYGIYTTPEWLGHIWQHTSTLPLIIECRKQLIMGLQRVWDKFIMAKINNIHITLRCYSLADILDGTCTALRMFVFQLQRQHVNSSYTWPRSKPCWRDYQLWMEAITAIIPFTQLCAWFHKGTTFLMTSCMSHMELHGMYTIQIRNHATEHIQSTNSHTPPPHHYHSINVVSSPIWNIPKYNLKVKPTYYKTHTIPCLKIMDILHSWAETWIWDQL